MKLQPPADLQAVEDHRFVGFNSIIGHRVALWRPGFVEMHLDIRPDLLNAGGVVHGGVLMSLLDSACGIASSFDEGTGKRRYSLTLAFNANFLKAASIGRLTIRAAKRGGGRNIFVCEAEIIDEAGDIVATGSGTFRYRSGERPDANPGAPPQPDISAGS